MAQTIGATPRFIEAAFLYQSQTGGTWQDLSNEQYFVFMSDFGAIRLRKRRNYPQTFAYVEGSILYFGYGDAVQLTGMYRLSGGPPPEAIFYDNNIGEFMMVAADCSRQTLTIQRDAICTLPIFVGHQGSKTIISNDYAYVHRLLDKTRLHIDTHALIGHFLGDHTYEKTLTKEIRVLCDRVQLVWNAPQNLYELRQPTSSSLLQIVDHRNEDPIHFRAILDQTLEQYFQRYVSNNILGLELSGGMDSSCIAAHLVCNKRPFLAATILYPGEAGRRQHQKLIEMADQINVVSRQFVADPARDYPLASMIRAGRPQAFYHRQELYEETFSRVADYMSEQGVDVVMRGVGGDELCENIPDLTEMAHETPRQTYERRKPERPDFFTENFSAYALGVLDQLPHGQRNRIPFTSETAVSAAVSGNNVYIDRGIWPIMPLADAKLYFYAQSLPPRYRMNKNILRAYGRARSVPESIYRPKTNEDFSDFFDQCMPYLRETFDACMERSVLNRVGLLDMMALRKAWDTPGENLFGLYQIMVAEMNLQA